MRFKVEWNQEDLEQMLRESLQQNGFHIPTDQNFRWHHRPKLRVTIEVEPAKNEKLEPPKKSLSDILPEIEDSVSSSKPEQSEESTEFDGWDPSLLPSGVNIEILKKLERAAAKEKKEKK